MYVHAVRESKESGELPTGIYGAFSPLLVTVALLFVHTMCYLGSPISGGWSRGCFDGAILNMRWYLMDFLLNSWVQQVLLT